MIKYTYLFTNSIILDSIESEISSIINDYSYLCWNEESNMLDIYFNRELLIEEQTSLNLIIAQSKES